MRHVLIALAVIGLVAVGVYAIDPLHQAVGHALHGDLHGLRAQLRGMGAAGAAVLVALILVHAVLPFPAEIVNAAAGLIFGVLLALPLVLAAWLVSGLLAYWLGVYAGRPIALKLAGERRVVQAEHVIDRGGAPALLICRLIPFVPYSLTGYLAGAARVPLWRYSWTSVVGIFPITAAATYLGHALDNLSASDPLLWVALGVLALLVTLSIVAGRRLRA